MPKKEPEKPEAPKKRSLSSYIFSTLLLFAIIVVLYSLLSGVGSDKTPTVTLSEVARLTQAGQVKSIVVDDQDLTVTKTDGSVVDSKKESSTSLVQTLSSYGVDATHLDAVDISVSTQSGFLYFLITISPFVLPILVAALFLWLLSRQAKGAGMQAFTFGQSKARVTDPNDKNNRVTFKDVAGAREAKEELKEIVDFLKNPKKFLDIGARIPKGVLLAGAPGTGKTLLARAVAGEAGVPFFHLSGSEFVEMFVGVGASRVRDLFKMAKRTAPAIIFIDEIDAVGRVRGGGYGGGNDEREQTLNQILVEMDGFEPNDKVIVMAATNRSDVLDPALLRPGRFDRRVMLDLPDRRDREDILNVHADKKPFGEDVNLKVIAERTPGFSGADLFSLMNEGAILAARENRKKISQFDLVRSIEKVMIGPERKSYLLNKKEKRITAYHEAAHALVASVLPNADPVHKITIISRGNALGYTMKISLEERKLTSKQEFLDDLAMSLAGYAVEDMMFGGVSTGPSGDLQQGTAIARAMVTRWGMSDAIGPLALEAEAGRPIPGQSGDGKEYSDETSALVDKEVQRIMTEALERAREVLTTHKNVLDVIANKLIEVETLEQPEYEAILSAHGIALKKLEA
ncbi:MAG TPA: ATP-dependent zinc metalloprotease FtsH [Candidatus Paceibacterota bacterium]|jgi:cell division protease FtsH|nr:ATP-dependent zinc metalloprotease FtsH [Candidatus Paceibacterota bacterium]